MPIKIYNYVDHHEAYLSPGESYQMKGKAHIGYRLPGERFLYIKISISNGKTYLVPQYYERNEHSIRFILKNHGAFNLVYFPLDRLKKDVVNDQPDFVYRVPFRPAEKMDAPLRTVRLWNEFYSEAYPENPVLSTASLYDDGVLLPYIPYTQERLSMNTVVSFIFQCYQERGRIFLDAFSQNNIVCNDNGDIYVLDFNAMLKVGNGKISNDSIVSDEMTVKMFSIYVSHFQHLLQKEYKKIKNNKAKVFSPIYVLLSILILFSALGIHLKSGVNFFKMDENGFVNQRVIAKLLEYFCAGREREYSDDELQFFENDPEEIIAQHASLLEFYKKTYRLDDKEINLADFHPSLKFYKNAFEKLSYFERVSALDIRFSLLAHYDLTNPKVFYTLAYVLLDKDINVELTAKNFTDVFEKYMAQDVSSAYYDALMSLAEKSHEHADRLYAFRVLCNLSVTDAQFLDKGYEFHLRKTHLNSNLSNQVETQNTLLELLALYRKSNKPYDLDKLVCLPEKSLSFLIKKEKGLAEKMVTGYRLFSKMASDSVTNGLGQVRNSRCAIM